jgi:hypothetical protein
MNANQTMPRVLIGQCRITDTGQRQVMVVTEDGRAVADISARSTSKAFCMILSMFITAGLLNFPTVFLRGEI